MTVFGETFATEIHAAGLGGLPFAWDPESGVVSGRGNLTSAQNAILTGVIAAHDPAATRPVDKNSDLTNREIEELIVAGTLDAAGVSAKKGARV